MEVALQIDHGKPLSENLIPMELLAAVAVAAVAVIIFTIIIIIVINGVVAAVAVATFGPPSKFDRNFHMCLKNIVIIIIMHMKKQEH